MLSDPATLAIWIDRMSPVPMHRQLYDALRSAIRSGQFTPGTRVPATRQLADQLVVSRTTVTTAYEQLIADGYLEGRRGAWTSVARELPIEPASAVERHKSYDRDATPRVSRGAAGVVANIAALSPRDGIAYNFRRPFAPALGAFPFKEWRRLVIEHWSTKTEESLTAIEPPGVPELRREVASYLRMTRGIYCDVDQVIITTGSQQAIDVLANIVVEPGDRVAIEDPSHLGLQYLFRCHDAELLPVPVDGDGLVVDALRAVRGQQPVLVHVMPTHQYPTGVMLSRCRRLDLLRWAEEHRALIVENDYASEFTYQGAMLESLQALDSAGVVAYVGTFTNALSPSIQIGYLIVPPPLVAAARAVHRVTARQAEAVHQHVLATFMQRGGLSRYLRRLRRIQLARRDALLGALRETFGDGVVIGPATSGLQVSVQWPNHAVTPDLLDRLEAAGVGVVPVHALYQHPPGRDCGVMMSYASVDEARIRAGVAVLGSTLRGG